MLTFVQITGTARKTDKIQTKRTTLLKKYWIKYFFGFRFSEDLDIYHTQCLVNILPAVSQSAERAGVVRIDDDHKPGIRSVKYVSNALCQDICTF